MLTTLRVGLYQACRQALYRSTAQRALPLAPQIWGRQKSTSEVVLDDNTSAYGSTKPEDFDAAVSIFEVNLSEETRNNLLKAGIKELFPVQAATFELVGRGADLLCRSKTGSGKTLAFALPIAEALRRPDAQRAWTGAPQACVLAPTRELARQVQGEFARLAPGLRTVCLYGGAPAGPQIADLRRGVHVAVGTPGRVRDHLESGALDLGHVRAAVLDEADRMLQVGFQEEVEHLLAHMPAPGRRQTLLWSATVPPWVTRLAQRYMNDPEYIDMVGEEDGRIPDTIKHTAILAAEGNRQSILASVLSVYAQGGRAIVFTQTKREADALAHSAALQAAGVRPLHGDLPQELREATLRALRAGHLRVLVATDVAARGLDIPDVDLVVHYRLPEDDEAFVHRCGRTGRAGRAGRSVALAAPRELPRLRRLERSQKFQFAARAAPQPEEVGAALARTMRDRLAAVPETALRAFRGEALRILQQQSFAATSVGGILDEDKKGIAHHDDDSSKRPSETKSDDHHGSVQALSAAMAIIAGMESHKLQVFSAMNGQAGYKSLEFEGIGNLFSDRRSVYQFLRAIDPEYAAAARGGRAAHGRGYADLPAPAADALTALARAHGLLQVPGLKGAQRRATVAPLEGELPRPLLDALLREEKEGGRGGGGPRGRGGHRGGGRGGGWGRGGEGRPGGGGRGWGETAGGRRGRGGRGSRGDSGRPASSWLSGGDPGVGAAPGSKRGTGRGRGGGESYSGGGGRRRRSFSTTSYGDV